MIPFTPLEAFCCIVAFSFGVAVGVIRCKQIYNDRK